MVWKSIKKNQPSSNDFRHSEGILSTWKPPQQLLISNYATIHVNMRYTTLLYNIVVDPCIAWNYTRFLSPLLCSFFFRHLILVFLAHFLHKEGETIKTTRHYSYYHFNFVFQIIRKAKILDRPCYCIHLEVAGRKKMQLKWSFSWQSLALSRFLQFHALHLCHAMFAWRSFISTCLPYPLNFLKYTGFITIANNYECAVITVVVFIFTCVVLKAVAPNQNRLKNNNN